MRTLNGLVAGVEKVVGKERAAGVGCSHAAEEQNDRNYCQQNDD